MTKQFEATEQPTTDAELQAIIREARARARRRRAKLGAVVAGGLVILALGWWGTRGGEPFLSGSDDPGPAAAGSGRSDPTAEQCPSQPTPEPVRTKSGGFRTEVPLCELTISADLPDGWIQRGRQMSLIPELHGAPNVVFPGQMPTAVTFTTAAPRAGAPAISSFQAPLPNADDFAIQLVPLGPREDPANGRNAEGPLRAGDFRPPPLRGQNLRASADLYRSGWWFDVEVRTGSAPADDVGLADANALLDSVTVDEQLLSAETRPPR